ncbi:MAG: TldD/PmbA family protein [Clostridia bacterium]|nr:TldD/PmbA family protein [Clostridia bacterium]
MNPNEAIARKCLSYLTAAGATQGVCVASVGTKTEFYYESGSLGLLRTVRNVTVSVKALVGTRKGVSSVNSFEEEDLKRAAEEAVSGAKISKEDPAEGLPEEITVQSFEKGPMVPDPEAMLLRMTEFFDELRERYPAVSVDSASLDHTLAESVYCATNGICLTTRQGAYSFSPMFMCREGEHTSSFNYFGAVFDAPTTPVIDLAGGRGIIEDSLKQINPAPLSGKFVGDVIFTPACFAGLLGSVEGNFLSDSVLIDGTSIWKDHLGKRVAAPCFTWSSRPRAEELTGGYFTTEGYVAEDMDIIKDGVLQNFVLGRYASKKTGLKRSPSGGGCYFVEGGTESLEEMIASVSHGLLVARFSGGDPTSDGTVSGVAKNSFEIKNGKIVGGVSEAMISGNLAKMLTDITSLSKERINDGTCVLPWVKINGITISGK